MSADGIVCRIQTTDAWASVNESIAPNAYRLPRNVEFAEHQRDRDRAVESDRDVRREEARVDAPQRLG